MQSVKTLTAKLSWQNGTQPQSIAGSFPPITLQSNQLVCGSASSVQKGRSTAGLQCLVSNKLQQDRLSRLCWEAACKCDFPQTLYPAIAAGWNQSERRPEDHTVNSTYLAWWSTPQRGSWQHSTSSQTSSGPVKAILIQAWTCKTNLNSQVCSLMVSLC